MSFQDEMRQLHWESEHAAPVEETSQYEIDGCARKVCDCIREQLKKQAAEGKLLYAVRACESLPQEQERFLLRYQVKWSATIHIAKMHHSVRYEVVPFENWIASSFHMSRVEDFTRILEAMEIELQPDDIFPVDERSEEGYRVAYRTTMQDQNYFQVVQEAKERESVDISYSVDFAYFL